MSSVHPHAVGQTTAQAPIGSADLLRVMADIGRIDEAGLLNELKGDIGYALLDRPTCDLDYCPIGQRINAERLADVAHRLLGVPLWKCLEAAIALVTLPRQQVALDIIAKYIAELETKTTTISISDGTPTAIARARQQATTARKRNKRRTA